MSTDQRLLDASYDLARDLVSRGIIDCEEPGEDETVEDFLRRKLREAGREVPE